MLCGVVCLGEKCMFERLKIGTRLTVLSSILIAALVVVGIMGLQGMNSCNAGLETVYNDRVIPLRDLKVIADMYAVNIVDTSHKARNGNLSFAEAIKNVDEARAVIKKKWSEYTATFLVDEEKHLIAVIEPLMAKAAAETGRLAQNLFGSANALLSESETLEREVERFLAEVKAA